ncbi:MAG: GH3 auxin-responsive promoter family protein, partial [Planctomycetales bacterium]|nr:GH3 auxin-responsive promoter family protein [Planctomycetales bacterium]
MMRTRMCNALWASFCAREAQRYHRACTLVRATQKKLLLDTLKRNASTEFGRRHHFHAINSIDEYRERVPLAEWRDVSPWVDRIAEGRPGVLTRDPVSVLEPTGGSTSIRKLIPYNADLRRQFQRAIRVWLHDLFSKRPALQQGRSYWSISPLANRPEKTRGGIRIGFESDSAYLSSVEQVLLLATLAAPPSVGQCQSVEAAQLATMFHLLNAADLSLISVWSPTFLTRLLDFLATHAERLCDSLRDGQLYIPSHWGEAPRGVHASIRRSVKRADYVWACVRDYPTMPELIRALWPRLGIVSCWADGPSAYFANDL